MLSPTHLSRLFAICTALLLLAAFPTTVSGATGTLTPRHEASRSQPHHGDSRNGGHVFPFLRWLRDSAVEAVFGRPESRGGSRGGAGRGKDGSAKRYGGATQSRYLDDVVVRFNVTSSEEEGALSEAADRLFLDVWAFTDEYVDVRLPRDDLASLMTLLPTSMQPSVLIPDVAAAVWATYPSGPSEKKILGPDWVDPAMVKTSTDGVDHVFFQNYQPLSVITSWLRLLEAMFPSYVHMTTIGKSYEGRDIMGVRLGARSEGNTKPGSRRKTILITGGIHAREWISTSTVNYLLWSLTTAYGKEPLITKLLQNFDFIFVPVVNPDGYEYTWEYDRLWRKSRQQTSMRFCRGLDLDRAFGYKWESARHQRDPCSESYGGDQPFQAVEASTLADWARNETGHGVEFFGYLDLHSYSQQILFPYSYTCSVDPPNRENLEELAAGLAKAVRLSSGEFYAIRSACEGAISRAYSASGSLSRIETGGGSAIDWFYHEMKARFSYQVRLRDTGTFGFLLPSEHIVPTGEEMLNAVKYFGDYLLGNNGIESLSVEKQSEAGDSGELVDLKRRKRR